MTIEENSDMTQDQTVEDVQQADTLEEATTDDNSVDETNHRADDGGSTEETEPETFPAKVVKDLRKENARYRERAGKADQLAQRLHTALVAGTGKLADPTDLEFDEAHLEDPDALATAVDDLLTRKPHLRARRVAGDVGQGNRGKTGSGPDLLEAMRGTL